MANSARSFEDLEVYQLAMGLAVAIYRASRNAVFAKDFGLTDQIRRSGVSVVSNIAEGFERNSNADLIQFLSIAKGSCGELRAQLAIAHELQYIDRESFDRLTDDARHVSAMLSKLISHVKASPYKGMRYERGHQAR
jgi:four helix bundle protein